MALSPTAPPFESDRSFPLGASANDCVPRFSTQAELLDLFDRIFPASYLDPLKNVGPGFELFQAYAKMFERASLAVGRLECGSFFTEAQGGARSTGTVQFFRATKDAGLVIIETGTIVRASKGGQQFRTTERGVLAADFVLTPEEILLGATSPIVADIAVEAIADGFEWDVPGEVLLPNDTLPGEIDTIELPLLEPPFGDSSIEVRQTSALGGTSGGRAAYLDGLGSNRGIPRNPNETDVNYAARLRTLPDTISPNAIIRTVHRHLDPLGACFDFIETFELRYQTFYDAPSAPIPGSDFDPSLFTYDDPRPDFPFQNRYLDVEDYRGAFIIILPNLPTILDIGMAYDDVDSDALADHTNATGGKRAHNAYDVDPATAPPAVVIGFYDGFDFGEAQIFKQLFVDLEQTKAGGVKVIFEQDPDL